MEEENKICNYRNCEMPIIDRLPKALYCCNNHAVYESIYRSRERKREALKLTVQDNSDIKE